MAARFAESHLQIDINSSLLVDVRRYKSTISIFWTELLLNSLNTDHMFGLDGLVIIVLGYYISLWIAAYTLICLFGLDDLADPYVDISRAYQSARNPDSVERTIALADKVQN